MHWPKLIDGGDSFDFYHLLCHWFHLPFPNMDKAFRDLRFKKIGYLEKVKLYSNLLSELLSVKLSGSAEPAVKVPAIALSSNCTKITSSRSASLTQAWPRVSPRALCGPGVTLACAARCDCGLTRGSGDDAGYRQLLQLIRKRAPFQCRANILLPMLIPFVMVS